MESPKNHGFSFASEPRQTALDRGIEHYPKDPANPETETKTERLLLGEALGDIKFEQTIELIPKTSQEYVQELEQSGYEFSVSYAKDLLDSLESLPSPENTNLLAVSPKQLGFSGRATLKEILDKALSLGLKLCQPQVGPELRLQYEKQLDDSNLIIAMNPIAVGSSPKMFSVFDWDSKKYLGVAYGGPNEIYNENQLFIFTY